MSITFSPALDFPFEPASSSAEQPPSMARMRAGESARWEGSVVCLKPGVISMMCSQAQNLGGSSRVNVYMQSGVLPMTLENVPVPSVTQEYVITKVRTASCRYVYKKPPPFMDELSRLTGYVWVAELAVKRESSELQTAAERSTLTELVVPLECLLLTTAAEVTDAKPQPGKEFYAPFWAVLQHRYDHMDHRTDGFSNKPTAALASVLRKNEALASELKAIASVNGRIEQRALQDLSSKGLWESTLLDASAFLTEGFPSQFRARVNYAELARAFSLA